MQQFAALRERLHMTQEELAERSGISVRTIQRIEAGQVPKGFTLKALAKSLEVSEEVLLNGEEDKTDHQMVKWAKLINLSSLPLLVFPPLNLLVPLLIMVLKKQRSIIIYHLISIQIVSVIAAVFLLLLVFMLNDWLLLESKYTLIIPLSWLTVNTIIICRNALELSRNNPPVIKPNLNFF